MIARHSAENNRRSAQMDQFVEQLAALKAHNAELVAKVASASSNTSTEMQVYTPPRDRRSQKSTTLQRSPPKNPTPSNTATKKQRSESQPQNRYAALTSTDDDDEETYTFSEQIDQTTDMLIDETAEKVSTLTLKKPPASGSNRAGKNK